ncbi:CD225/dispanin family protein [Cellulomonas sp. DKR-3]|uniref:CD225/dispanin family protein n=1 Tax=Cellulomonas fulva TaxID=2835530 RepID=A0ABS5U1E1_9CELL|nr:CD225/dispanin family protein [Cellulomonas fulva]
MPGTGYGAPPPPNYLVWAILSAVLCCTPLGIVSIVFAAQVNGKWMAGDAQGAFTASRRARTWAIAAAVVGLIFVPIAFLSGIFDASSGSM